MRTQDRSQEHMQHVFACNKRPCMLSDRVKLQPPNNLDRVGCPLSQLLNTKHLNNFTETFFLVNLRRTNQPFPSGTIASHEHARLSLRSCDFPRIFWRFSRYFGSLRPAISSNQISISNIASAFLTNLQVSGQRRILRSESR